MKTPTHILAHLAAPSQHNKLYFTAKRVKILLTADIVNNFLWTYFVHKPTIINFGQKLS